MQGFTNICNHAINHSHLGKKLRLVFLTSLVKNTAAGVVTIQIDTEQCRCDRDYISCIASGCDSLIADIYWSRDINLNKFIFRGTQMWAPNCVLSHAEPMHADSYICNLINMQRIYSDPNVGIHKTFTSYNITSKSKTSLSRK